MTLTTSLLALGFAHATATSLQDKASANVHELTLQFHEGPEYSCLVEMGTSIRRYFMKIDLNYPDLLVTSATCKTGSGATCASKETYDPSQSSTAVRQGKKMKDYQTKVIDAANNISVVADKYKELVCVGPTADGCVKDQDILSVVTENLPYGPYDGILGLQAESDNVFTNLVKAGYYENLFAIHIAGGLGRSHITFGGITESYQHDATVAVDYFSAKNGWGFEASGLTWNDLDAFSTKHRNVEIDLNSYYITLPSDSYEFFLGNLKAAKNFIVDDSNPDMLQLKNTVCGDVDFSSLMFSFPATHGKSIKHEVPQQSLLVQNPDNAQSCEIMVKKGTDTIMLGAPFLMNYYVVFNGKDK